MQTRRKGAHGRNYAVGSEVAENGKWKSSLAVYRKRYKVLSVYGIRYTVYGIRYTVYGIRYIF